MSTETSDHTPPPWRQVTLHPNHILGAGQRGDQSFSIEPDLVFASRHPREGSVLANANAAFIVRAVNSHDELAALVEELTDELERIAHPADGIGKLRHRARATLSKARGETPEKSDLHKSMMALHDKTIDALKGGK